VIIQKEDINMSLELVRETVKVNRLVGSGSARTVVDNDIIVPDVKPDVARIISLDGYAVADSSQVSDTGILVRGKIYFKILYICEGEEQSVKGIDTGCDFTYTLDVPNAERGMGSRVKCDVEHVQYEILNGRKINTKTVLKVEAKVFGQEEKDIVINLSGGKRIQVLRKKNSINCYIGEEEEKSTITEELEVPSGKPAIRELLRNDVKIINKSSEIIDNKVIAKGELSVSSMYVGDDESGSIQYMEHGIPFTRVITLPGVTENSSCRLEYKVTGYQFDPEEDGDGELRSIKADIEVSVLAEGSEKKEFETVADAYGLDVRLDVDSHTLRLEGFSRELTKQIGINDVVEMDEDFPEVHEVFNVACKAGVSDVRIGDGKLVVEGVTQNSVFYLPEDEQQPVMCISREIPFEGEFDIQDIDETMSCDVEVDVEHCNFSLISTKEIEIRPTLTITARVTEEVEIPMVDSVRESEQDTRALDERPSIVIYYAQQGDSLWELAKRYYTTVEEIQEVNDITDDSLLPGRQVIIPKRA